MDEKYERNGWPSLPRPDIQSPDGWSIPLLTGVNRVYNHSLSRDGKQIAFIWNREGFSDIYVISAMGGWPKRMTFDRPAKQYWWDEIPRWSLDNQSIAFCMNKQVYITPVSGGIPRLLSRVLRNSTSPRWIPNSDFLVVSIEEEIADKLFLVKRDGSVVRELTDDSGDARDPQPSPDGKHIAFTHRSFADLNRYEIRTVEIKTGMIRKLTGETMQKDWQPRWSPDSKKIAYVSQRTGFYEIWILDIDTGNTQQLTKAGVDFSDFEWSKDGKTIAATINRNGVIDLVTINIGTREVSDLWTAQGIFNRPYWAPNDRFISVEYNDPVQPPAIYRLDLAKGADGKILVTKTQQLTFSKPPALDNLKFKFPEKIKFLSSDGVEIPALLYKPEKPNGAAIVHPHGGPRDQSVYEWQLLPQYLIAKGYTYLEVNYRGSTGYGKKYEFMNQNNWGIGDTQDCIHACKYLSAQPWIDKDRIAIMGGSYGGYLTICALARDPLHRFACGVAIYGDADLYSSWALCERDTRLYTEMQLGHPAANRKIYKEGSPIYQVENIIRPILILHGLEDEVVPPQASEVFVEALRRAGKQYEYKTYAKESHGFLSNDVIQDVYTRIERFLDWYLLPKPM